jgi:hypothetical protein
MDRIRKGGDYELDVGLFALRNTSGGYRIILVACGFRAEIILDQFGELLSRTKSFAIAAWSRVFALYV